MITESILKITQQKYLAKASDYQVWYNTHMHRGDLVEKQYEEHKAEIKSMGVTIEDYILGELGVKKGQTFAIINTNKFRYNLPSEWQHKLIWCSDNISYDTATYMALDYVGHIHYYMFQAPEQSQSVKGIKHYHLTYII